jgi:[glutamine synthetase] adenylyltransferase / [glutamine synthetase]-adenylyl-L-tyrosine phosphorylase
MKIEGSQLHKKIEGFSPYLTHILRRKPYLVESLFTREGFRLKKSLKQMAQDLRDKTAGITDLTIFCSLLRQFKEEEILCLAARDLGGAADLKETTAGFSALAQVCLQKAIQFCMETDPKVKDLREGPALEKGLVALGLGKLGGQELNFSSDVDLIFLYEPNPALPLSPLDQKEIIQSVTRKVIQVMSAQMEGDHVFRMDLGLRPGGKDSDLVLSWESALEYYQTAARTWERMAMVKARPVAGNLLLGKLFLKEVHPVLYRKFVDFSVLTEIRSMKQRILKEASSHFLKGDDIKLGPGGIREIEFIVQALQMVFGGRIPFIQEKNTLKALEKLKEALLISKEECRRLIKGYHFLRNLEHRLQMVHQRQTQSLPSQTEALENIARMMYLKGYKRSGTVKGFLQELDQVRSQVRISFDNLLLTSISVSQERVSALLEASWPPEQWMQELTQLGFHQWSSAQEIIESWGIKIRRSKAGGTLLEKLLPDLLGYVLQSVNPDAALVLTDRFLQSIGGRSSILSMLFERGALAKEIVDLFSRSAMMGRLFVQNPDMMDHLALQRTIGRPSLESASLVYGKRRTLKGDMEEQYADLRRWKNGFFLGTALEEISGRLSSIEASEKLTLIADQVLMETRRLAEEGLAQEVVHPLGADRGSAVSPSPFCILGLGKMGGMELGYTSDMDLVFVYSLKAPFLEAAKVSGKPQPARPERKRITYHEYMVRLAQRLISYLSMPLKEGPGYAVDARLRPSGSFGPLIVTLDSFKEYYQTQAQNWEKQALMKARVIVGPPQLSQQIREVIDQIVFGASPSPEVRREIRLLRTRMEKERAGETQERVNPKLGYGGLTDIEFICQYLQWIYGQSDPGLRQPNTLKGLRALKEKGYLAEDVHYVLKEAYEFLTTLDHGLQLLFDRKSDPRTYTLDELTLTAKQNLMGLGEAGIPAWNIYDHYNKIRQKVRSIFNQIFYQ